MNNQNIMRVTILHLTDLHFTSNTDIKEKIQPLVNLLSNEAQSINYLYIILSGDLAYSGKKEEYETFNKFISPIRTLLTGNMESLQIKTLLVPGNHDCDFDSDDDLRKHLLQDVSYDSLGNDNSIINNVLKVQSNFWEYFGKYHDIPTDKLYFSITEKIGDYTINFNCHNTAWMSSLKEKAGTLFFPVKKYQNTGIQNNGRTFNIGIWHHPYNWFNPSTRENNKLEFENFTQSVNQIMLFGHEHESSLNKSEDLKQNRRHHLISGKVFYEEHDPNNCGFNLISLDLQTEEIDFREYQWYNDHFKEVNHNRDKINIVLNNHFQLADGLLDKYNELRIPIISNSQRKIKLSDIFVFPDMEKNTKTSIEKLESYIDSSKLLSDEYSYCVLDGESQIGKSSLLQMLFVQLWDNRKYPVYICADEIGKDFSKTIKKSFQKHYQNSDQLFDKYLQLSKSDKVLLIDDFNLYKFNGIAAKEFITHAKNTFGKVIITVDSTHSLLPTLQAELGELSFFTLKDFGYKKRNQIIEKYHSLKLDVYDPQRQQLLEDTKNTFNNINHMLGNNLMPAYPVFIISLIQALEYKPINQNETSYGYCYQTLLHFSLHKAGVKNEHLDGYFNLLTELSYELVTLKSEHISVSEFEDFYQKYKSKFIIPSYNDIYSALINSKIILEKENSIRFGYKYILYYLAAKKYSDILHTEDGKKAILNLFKEIENEENANILVFITHHSKDISFIEDCLLTSMTILENIVPITLEKNDPYYKLTEQVSRQISSNIIDTQRNPINERDKILEHQDRQRRIEQAEEENQQNIPEEINNINLPFYQSFRSIELIGQIIRNRTGSIEKEQLSEMIREVYEMSFRTIAYLGELFKKTQELITESIKNDLRASDTSQAINEKINLFIQMHSLKACLNIFGKLIHCMGNKELKEIFKNTATKFGTPAAKIVSFSINSYYNEISISELKALAKELEGNVVATGILKSRVKSYVYNRELDYKTKQQIASAAGFKLDHSKNKVFASKR